MLASSTFFKYEGNNERDCFHWPDIYIRTMLGITQNFDQKSTAFSIPPIFQYFGGTCQYRSIIDAKSKQRIKHESWTKKFWRLTFCLLQREKKRCEKKKAATFQLAIFFPRDALRTIHLVVHHPVNPLHAVGAWLSIFQGFVEYGDTSGGKTSGRCCRVDRPRHRSEIEIDRPGRSSRSLAGLVRRQTAGLTVEPGLIEFRVRAERRFVIPASNLAASRATLFRQPRPSSSSGRLSRRVRAAGRQEILSAEWCCVDTYLEQNGNEIDQFCGTALIVDAGMINKWCGRLLLLF